VCVIKFIDNWTLILFVVKFVDKFHNINIILIKIIIIIIIKVIKVIIIFLIINFYNNNTNNFILYRYIKKLKYKFNKYV